MTAVVSCMPKKSRVLTEKEAERFSMLFKMRREDREWIERNYNKLKKNYPGEYIAVRNQTVVGIEKRRERLIENLKKEFDDVGGITIEYMGEKPLKLLM